MQPYGPLDGELSGAAGGCGTGSKHSLVCARCSVDLLHHDSASTTMDCSVGENYADYVKAAKVSE